jgi:WD40 repeat protein
MTCGRQAFVEGEEPEVRAVLRLLQPAQDVRLSLRLNGPGIDAEVLSTGLRLGGKTEHVSLWQLPTAQLAEGDYRLVGTVKLAGGHELRSQPLQFFVKERVRDSDMPFLGGAGSYGGEMPYEPWDSARPPAQCQPTIAVAFHGAAGRTMAEFQDTLLERAREDPRLPPPDFFQGRRTAAIASDYLLRHGTAYMVIPFSPQLSQNLYHTIRREEEQHSLFVSQSVGQFRPFPNYAGPFYKAGDQAMPITTVGTGDDYNIGTRLAVLKKRLDEEVKDVADEYERKLRFYEGWNNVWAGCMANWQAVSDRMDSRLIDGLKWHFSWEFGTQARGGGFNPIALRPLKVRIGVENTDISLAPLHGPFEVDNYGFGRSERDKVVWVGGIPRDDEKYPTDFSYWPRQVFSMLGRGAQGIGFALDEGQRLQIESIRATRDLVRRYGNLFLSLRRDDRVAILRSFAQSALGPGGYGARGYQAYYTLVRARFPAGFVTEEEIDAGALDDLDALILVSQTVNLPKKTAGLVGEFVRKGGVVIGDETTTIDLPGLRKLAGVSFDGQIRQNLADRGGKSHWSYQMDGSTEYKAYFDEAQPFLSPVREALSAQVRHRLLDTASPHLMTFPLYSGKWGYVTVVNDTFPQTDAPMYQVQTLPLNAKLELLARDCAVYDLLEMKEVTPAEENGKLTIEADFRRLPGRIFAFASERVHSVRLGIPSAVKRGAMCPVTVQVLDPDGHPVNGSVPIQLRVLNPQGGERFQLFRAASLGEYSGEFPVALNEAPGKWQVEARELLTGLVAGGTLEVEANAKAPSAGPLPEVLVYDGQDCHEFLRSPDEKTILLDVTQRGLVAPVQAACEKLQGRNIKVRWEVLDPHRIRYFIQRWIPTEADEAMEAALRRNELIGRPVAGDDPLIRRPGYEFKAYFNWPDGFIVHRDLILVGSPQTNRLLAEIQGKALLYREMADSFPGPGRGVVQYCWTPFSWGHDAVVVGAQDEEGLKKSLETLDELAERPFGIEPERSPRYLPFPFAQFENPPELARQGQGGPPERKSFASAKSVREDFARERFGEAISGIQVAGDRLLVSFNSYGGNLVLADTAGNVLWRRKVTEYDIVDATLSQDGKRIAAKATGTPGGLIQLPDMQTGGFRPGSRYFVILDDTGEIRLKAPVEEDGVVDFERQRIVSGWDTRLVAFDLNGELQWSYDDWRNAKTLEQCWHRRRARRVWLSHDSSTLFAGFWGFYGGPGRRLTEESPALFLFDPVTGERKAVLDDCMVERVVSSPSGACMAIVEPERLEVVFEPGKEEYRPRHPAGTRPVRILSARGEVLKTVPLSPPPQLLAVSDDGQFLACGSGAELTLLDLPKDNARRFHFERGIHDLRFSPDCKAVAVADQSGLLRLVDLQGGIVWERRVAGAGRLRFDKDGSYLYVGTHIGRLYRFSKDGALAWTRDLSDDVALDDPNQAIRQLQELPSLRYSWKPDEEKSLFEQLPKTVYIVQDIWPREGFEGGEPGWIQQLECVVFIRKDPHSGRQALALAAPIEFRFPPQGPRDAYVFELAAKAPKGKSFEIDVATRRGYKLFGQQYEADGAWRWERFAFKNLEDVAKLTISPPAGAELLIDDCRFARLRFAGRNVAYIMSGEELAKQETALGKDAKETDVTTAKVWVFNEKCWTGGGRRSRGDMSPFPGSLVPMVLANGRVYDTEDPLYQGRTWSRKYEWVAADNWGSFEFVTPKPQKVHTLAVYDSPKPGYATRSALFQAWQGKETGWVTLAVFRGNRHAFHVHALQPVKAQRFRYVLLEPGPRDALFRTTEVEVYADADDLLDEEFNE